MTRPSRRWQLGPRLLVAGVLLFLFVGLVGFSPSRSDHRPFDVGPAPVRLAAGSCSGPPEAGTFSGRMVVLGSRLAPPPTGNVTLALTFYELTNQTSGGSSVLSCPRLTQTFSTDSSGNFSVTALLGSNGCSGGVCVTHSGPYGPITISNLSRAPAGYFFESNLSKSPPVLAWVAALDALNLDPAGRETVSVDAPSVDQALAVAGDGSRTPATVTYAWDLTGSGWSIVRGAGTSELTFEASDGAGPALLSAWANGTFDGANLSVGPARLQLSAAPTRLTAGEITPTSLDAGGSATFLLNGTGAAGYNYTAMVSPGLGLSGVAAPCSGTSAVGGRVDLSCQVAIQYSEAGTAQPTANLTNGFSSSTWSFVQVVVAAAMAVSVSPDPALGYVGEELRFSESPVAGTGTPPFGPGCMYVGSALSTCHALSGSSTSFTTSFSTAGDRALRFTMADSGAANVSVTVIASVVARPVLQPIVAASNQLNTSGWTELGARVSGGAFPLQYWWNDSNPDGTVSAGTISSDGTLSLRYVGTLSGEHLITLSLVDALGSRVAQSAILEVTPGPAVRIDWAGNLSSLEQAAGQPVEVRWSSLDWTGNVVTGFAGPVDLTVPRSGGWFLNVSGFGAVPPNQQGAFRIPGSAWHSGHLEFGLTSLEVGEFSVGVNSTVPVWAAPGGRLSVVILPDFTNLKLFGPSYVHPGSRSNSTLWQISDRFGNPIVSGFVVVRSLFGSTNYIVDSPIHGASGGAAVWVNYSAPDDSGGTVYVLSQWNQSLLAPFSIPGLPPLLLPWTQMLGVAVASLGMVVAAIALWPTGAGGSPDEERVSDAELERYARGQEFVRARSQTGPPFDIEELVRDWPGPDHLAAAEASEWVGSLVSDGTLRAVRDSTGPVRFAAETRPARSPGTPRVEFDEAAWNDAVNRSRDSSGAATDPGRGNRGGH